MFEKLIFFLFIQINGFGRQLWDSYIDDCSVVMSYLSEDFEEGYPGALLVTVRFKLKSDNKLIISIRASTTKPTIVNISHGSYFNLAGHVNNFLFKIYKFLKLKI